MSDPQTPDSTPTLLQTLKEQGKVVALDFLGDGQALDLLQGVLAGTPQALEQAHALSYNNRNRLVRLVPTEEISATPSQRLAALRVLYAPDLLTQQLLCDVLKALPESPFAGMTELLELVCLNSYPKARVFAARVLIERREHSPEDVRNLLMEWAVRPEPELRETVALSYRHGAPERGYTLDDVRMLDQLSIDEFSLVRRQVAIAMRDYLAKPYPEAFNIVERLSRDNRWETAASAIESVGFAGPSFIRQALRLLRSFLMSENRTLSRKAIRGLRQLAHGHPRRTMGYFREIVQERTWMDLDVLQTVLHSLRDLYARNPQLATTLIREMTIDDDPMLREQALKLLEELGIADLRLGEG